MKLRPKHIGIVGCSAEGAALCYRTILEFTHLPSRALNFGENEEGFSPQSPKL